VASFSYLVSFDVLKTPLMLRADEKNRKGNEQSTQKKVITPYQQGQN
jgi:hypothetical protein